MAAAAAKSVVLITGANSGVGFELAAQLLAKGSYHVLVGSRSATKGTAAVSDLTSRSYPGTAELLELDVTSDASIHAAFDSVSTRHGRLDLLVNNAGISAMTPPLRQQMRDAFDTNATGPAVLTEVFAPLLRKAREGQTVRIVNVSSGAGSIAQKLDKTSRMHKMQAVQYRASKAAMNMVTACQHVEYEDLGWKVFAFCPGYTVSQLSDINTAEKGARSAEESVRPLVEILEGKRDGEAGLFLHRDGVYSW